MTLIAGSHIEDPTAPFPQTRSRWKSRISKRPRRWTPSETQDWNSLGHTGHAGPMSAYCQPGVLLRVTAGLLFPCRDAVGTLCQTRAGSGVRSHVLCWRDECQEDWQSAYLSDSGRWWRVWKRYGVDHFCDRTIFDLIRAFRFGRGNCELWVGKSTNPQTR